MSEDQKLDLKLNEDNELSFRLSIEGTVSDPDLAPPNFRFTIMETGGGTRGWIFPATKEDNDIVKVRIPAPLKEGFSSNKSYHGKLEVIIGRLYFSPAEMMLEFSAPLSVKAEALNKSVSVTNPSNRVVATVISNKPVAPKPVISVPAPIAAPIAPTPILEEEVDLSDSELAEILSVIRERKAPVPSVPVAAPKPVIRHEEPKRVPAPTYTPTPAVQAPAPAVKVKQTVKPKQGPTLQEKEAFKSKFMSMFREALIEVKK